MTPHEPLLLHHPQPVVPMEPALHVDTMAAEASNAQLLTDHDTESSIVSSVELNPGTPWISVGTVLQCTVAFSLTAAIVFTNLLVLLVRIRDKQLRKQVSSFFIKSLAVSDLSVGIFQSVPGIIGVLRGGGWNNKDELGYWWVKLSVYGTSTAAAVSMYAVMAISIDRYIAVTRPLRYWAIVGDKKYAKLSMAGAWLAAAVLMLPILTPLVPTHYSVTTFAAVLDYGRCIPYVVALAYVVYLPCTLTLLVVYGVILRISRRHVRRIDEDRRRCSLSPVAPESVARRTKYLRNSLFIIATFLLTWLPRGGYIAYEIVAGGPVPWADFVTLWLTLSNNFNHAMIYNWFHKDFRRALRETLHFCPFYGRKRTYEQLVYSIHVPTQAVV